MINKSDWTVKNVKTFEGMEGVGFNCSLYYKGKRVCKAIDDASGGPYMYHWVRGALGEGAEKALEQYVKEQAPEERHGMTLDYNADYLIGELLDEFEINKQYRGWCRTKIVFRKKGDTDPDSWRTVKGKFTEKNMVAMRERYPDLGEVLNYRFGEPA